MNNPHREHLLEWITKQRYRGRVKGKKLFRVTKNMKLRRVFTWKKNINWYLRKLKNQKKISFLKEALKSSLILTQVNLLVKNSISIYLYNIIFQFSISTFLFQPNKKNVYNDYSFAMTHEEQRQNILIIYNFCLLLIYTDLPDHSTSRYHNKPIWRNFI